MAQSATASSAGSATPGAEDGSQPSIDSTDPARVDAAGDAGHGAGPDDDDDSDDDDYADVPFNEHPRFKQLTRKLAKTRRQLAKARPLAERVKDVDLDALTVKARTSDQLQELLAGNPKLRQQVIEAMSKPAGAPAEAEAEFDPSTLPFDVTDESGKFFAQFYKEFRDLRKKNGDLEARLKGMGEATASQQRVAEGRTWKTAVDAAGAKVPEAYRDMFHDACYGAFKEARERNVRLDPQRVIDHYLTKLGGNKRTQDAASAAAAQRIAEANKKLPQQPAHPGGAAGAKGDRKETVADVNRRMKQLFAR